MNQMVEGEELKILNQMEMQDLDLQTQKKSYNELMQYVSNSSAYLQNKHKQGKEQIVFSIEKVANDPSDKLFPDVK
jgi:gas vesicle protein